MDLDPLDGNEHFFFAMGAWVGNQGAALRLMGAGSILGVWRLRTPYTELGFKKEIPFEQNLAIKGVQEGAISIEAY